MKRRIPVSCLRELPKADFTYINGSPVPPGVFFVYVNNGSEAGYDVSTLGIDESYVLTSI